MAMDPDPLLRRAVILLFGKKTELADTRGANTINSVHHLAVVRANVSAQKNFLAGLVLEFG